MDHNQFKRISTDRIDIYKKEPVQMEREQVTNLALKAIRYNFKDRIQGNQILVKKILFINEKVKDKKPSKLANIIQYWLSEK
jgi:hypothetical protein